MVKGTPPATMKNTRGSTPPSTGIPNKGTALASTLASRALQKKVANPALLAELSTSDPRKSMQIDFTDSDNTQDESLSTEPAPMDNFIHANIPSFVLEFQQQFRDVFARLNGIDSVLQENAVLKDQLAAAQARIAELEKSFSASATNRSLVDHYDDPNTSNHGDPTAGSNASRWAKVAAPKHNQDSANKSHQKATGAAATTKHKPNAAKQKGAAARAFKTPDDGPQGFKYVYIPRSHKMTRVEVRRRFRKMGIDTSRVLDLTFPATGIIGILIHLQYVSEFKVTLLLSDVDLISNFDPTHLADPKSTSISASEREDAAFELNTTRCANAVSFLAKTRPHQAAAVGRSFIELGWLCEEGLSDILSQPPQVPAQRTKNSTEAAKAFSPPVPTTRKRTLSISDEDVSIDDTNQEDPASPSYIE